MKFQYVNLNFASNVTENGAIFYLVFLRLFCKTLVGYTEKIYSPDYDENDRSIRIYFSSDFNAS